MHLEKIEPITPLTYELSALEEEMMPFGGIRQMENLCFFTAVGIPIIVAVLAGLLGAGMVVAMLAFLSTMIITAYKVFKYQIYSEYLPDSAQKFLLTNKANISGLEAHIEDFNQLLDANKNGQKLLSTVSEKEDTNLAEYWKKSRSHIQEEVDALLDRYRAATHYDMQCIEHKHHTNLRLRRRAFKQKAAQLKKLEDGLRNLPDDGDNSDEALSPYGTAINLRRQLEREQLKLEKLGVSKKALQKALPPRKKQTKLLKP